MAKKKTFEIKFDVKFPSVKEIKSSGLNEKLIGRALVAAQLSASTEIERNLPMVLDKAMGSPVWEWSGRATFRQNGEIAGTPRDIIDTGHLASTLKLTTKFMATKVQTKIAYSAPYAGLVHNGGAILPYGDSNRNTVLIPGRPWIDAVMKGGVSGIEKYDYKGIYQAHVEKEWAKIVS
jgi:hypothetical protein